MKLILTIFFKIMIWIADTHAVLGGFLCFLTAVAAVTACYMELLIVVIPLTFILFVYVLMIIIYCTMNHMDREYLKWGVMGLSKADYEGGK